MIRRPMKGVAVEDLSTIKLPCWGMPKIDGFRCVLGQYPMTSTLSRFPNDHFHYNLTGLLPRGCFLDGEVVVGRQRGRRVLQRTSSGLTSVAGTPSFRLLVFDRPGLVDNPGWNDRYVAAHDLIGSLDHPQVHLLSRKWLETYEDLVGYIDRCLRLGYEGIITRSDNGPYKEGKSTLREQYMLKVKPFEGFEARITGYFEERENTNEPKREKTGKLKRSSAQAGKRGKGTLGGFIGRVLDSKGRETRVEVRVGGGFTKAQRAEYWLRADELVAAGAIMECYKQLMGEKDKPRHPNFRRLRPEWDLS